MELLEYIQSKITAKVDKEMKQINERLDRIDDRIERIIKDIDKKTDRPKVHKR